ncbi:Magnesium transporter MRS2-2 [Camellia lanceoleosa]|uniref:Magnesium transporter MRS2-2 n=1 Tax=Camellia lanceoleosa TaxID=1840588 RepID=A0ACC0GGT7_9ERIC|nr:Magnesium transporter MRS2-2 [Camellia lanceoleosa]
MNTSTNLNQSASIVKDEAKVTRQRARLERRRMRIMRQKIPSPPPPHRPLPLHLLHIKAIVTSEEVLLRDPLDDNVIPIVEELQRRLPPVIAISQDQGEDEEQQGAKDDVESEFPFEFRALEVALEGICSFLDARTRELETAAYPALDELTSKVKASFTNCPWGPLRSRFDDLKNAVFDLDQEIPTLSRLKKKRIDHSYDSRRSTTSSIEDLEDIMEEPCVAADGYAYDRKAVRTWLEENDKSPITNLPLPTRNLIPNYTLLSAISEWKSGKQ